MMEIGIGKIQTHFQSRAYEKRLQHFAEVDICCGKCIDTVRKKRKYANNLIKARTKFSHTYTLL